MPQLWPQFEALKHVPVLVVRGENSDLLSEATVSEMKKRHPNLVSIRAAKEGHAPLLWDMASTSAIAEFFAASDVNSRRRASAAA